MPRIANVKRWFELGVCHSLQRMHLQSERIGTHCNPVANTQGISIERGLLERAKARATQQRRSFSGHVVWLIERDLAQSESNQEGNHHAAGTDRNGASSAQRRRAG